MRPADLARLSAVGMRTRTLRAALSALGIAIGVAAIVAVLGLSSSSQAGLINEISKLGTNLLTVANGQTLSGDTAELPLAAPGMIARIGPVTAVEDTGRLSSVNAYRSPLIPPINTNALSVQAASLGLPHTVGTSVAQGRFLNAATAHEPVAVLGAAAAAGWASTASTLANGSGSAANGSTSSASSTRPCSPPKSTPQCSSDTPPPRSTSASTATPPRSTSARTPTRSTPFTLLAATANPEHPNQVDVAQPSDALVAQAEAKGALNSLFLGLGAVSLLSARSASPTSC